MKYGLSDSEFQFLEEKLIDPLKRQQAQVFLFGSRANGKYKKFSDIDLVYVLPNNLTIPGYIIQAILSEIEDSAFPYKIDLVNKAELATSYENNFEQEKILL